METKHLECKFVFEIISAWIRGTLMLIYPWSRIFSRLYLRFFLLSLRANIIYTISCNTTSKLMDSHRSSKEGIWNWKKCIDSKCKFTRTILSIISIIYLLVLVFGIFSLCFIQMKKKDFEISCHLFVLQIYVHCHVNIHNHHWT